MNGQKKKILLVEDDMALSAVYRSRLEIEGFDVREANNGEDALSATVEYHPDLILLDVMTPCIIWIDINRKSCNYIIFRRFLFLFEALFWFFHI